MPIARLARKGTEVPSTSLIVPLASAPCSVTLTSACPDCDLIATTLAPRPGNHSLMVCPSQT